MIRNAFANAVLAAAGMIGIMTIVGCGAHHAKSGLPRIVCLGDSLTRGFGVRESEARPALVQQKLDAAGRKYEVVNAGGNGDSIADADARLDDEVADGAAVLVIGLGLNDALSQRPIDEIAGDLELVLEHARKRVPDAKIVLVGMRTQPRFGESYFATFRDLYPSVAAKCGVKLVPYLLEGVEGEPGMMQPDGLHPTVAGHRVIAETMFAALHDVL